MEKSTLLTPATREKCSWSSHKQKTGKEKPVFLQTELIFSFSLLRDVKHCCFQSVPSGLTRNRCLDLTLPWRSRRNHLCSSLCQCGKVTLVGAGALPSFANSLFSSPRQWLSLSTPHPCHHPFDPSHHEPWHAAQHGRLEQRFKLTVLILPPD